MTLRTESQTDRPDPPITEVVAGVEGMRTVAGRDAGGDAEDDRGQRGPGRRAGRVGRFTHNE